MQPFVDTHAVDRHNRTAPAYNTAALGKLSVDIISDYYGEPLGRVASSAGTMFIRLYKPSWSDVHTVTIFYPLADEWRSEIKSARVLIKDAGLKYTNKTAADAQILASLGSAL